MVAYYLFVSKIRVVEYLVVNANGVMNNRRYAVDVTVPQRRSILSRDWFISVHRKIIVSDWSFASHTRVGRRIGEVFGSTRIQDENRRRCVVVVDDDRIAASRRRRRGALLEAFPCRVNVVVDVVTVDGLLDVVDVDLKVFVVFLQIDGRIRVSLTWR